jgi:osmoprotectant transport system permease protein
MSPWRQLYHLEIPLAFPVILAGIKTATVEAIASATLAAFVGAGGLGDFILLGFSLYDPAVLLVGAIPVALLSFGAEVILSLLVRFGKWRTVA